MTAIRVAWGSGAIMGRIRELAQWESGQGREVSRITEYHVHASGHQIDVLYYTLILVYTVNQAGHICQAAPTSRHREATDRALSTQLHSQAGILCRRTRIQAPGVEKHHCT